jgi:dihydrofolate reductase
MSVDMTGSVLDDATKQLTIEAVRSFTDADNPSAFLGVNEGTSRFVIPGQPGVITFRAAGRYLVQFGGPLAPPGQHVHPVPGFYTRLVHAKEGWSDHRTVRESRRGSNDARIVPAPQLSDRPYADIRMSTAGEFAKCFAAGPNGELDFVTETGAAADPTSGPFVEKQLAFIEGLDTILLGAVTYRMFADYWPRQTVETEGIADALNATPKVVFSKTIDRVAWGDWEEPRVVAGSASEEVRRLKGEPGKDLVVWGSLSLADSLMRDGLVDEYRLWVCPVLLGRGRRLFEHGLETRWLTRLETKTYDSVVAVRYEVARS